MKTTLKFSVAALALGLGFSGPARADDTAVMRDYAESNLRSLARDPAVIAAVKAQNLRHATITQSQIEVLDATWQQEIGQAETPTIAAVMDHPLSAMLRAKVEGSAGEISELFVMDYVGLNVAASGVTSDYWQGDEAKFSESFGKGAASIHFGAVERDESTGTYQAQISITVVDEISGEPIGALTAGVNAEALF